MQMMRWYKITEDKSEIPIDTIILLANKEKVYAGYYSPSTENFYTKTHDPSYIADMKFTHWMELPNPPSMY